MNASLTTSRRSARMLAACAAVFVMAFAATGEASLLTFEFGGATASDVNPNIMVTSVTNGGNLSQFDVSANDGYATQPVLHTNPGNTVSQDVDTAFTNGNYFEFTVTPNDGRLLNLTSLGFNAGRGGSTGLPRNIGVRSSLTGTTNLLATAVPTTRPTFTPFSVDLVTGSFPVGTFQDVTSPITFQFAVATNSTGRSIEWDNITLLGTAVPEPSCALLLFAGLTATLFRRRQRRLVA